MTNLNKNNALKSGLIWFCSISLNLYKIIDMNSPAIQTLSFIFDNKTDHILLFQIADEGPLKRKHSGIKGVIGLLEDPNAAAIRSIQESTGLEVSEAVLRGVVKTINPESQTAAIYFVYESSKFSGAPESKIPGRLKWVDILDIFNLQMESLVQEIMPNLLDGESFFEGTIQLNGKDEVISSDIRICNTI
jgi:ADP-ribose pyrophosphatase YjhB (NUDIX family)